MRGGEEISQEFFAVLRRDGLRMKLNAVQRSLSMREPHNDVVFGPRRYLKAFRQGLRNHERVIPDRLETLWNAFEETLAVVMDRAHAAVKRFGCVGDLTAEGRCHSLKAQAYAEHRHVCFEKNLATDAEVARVVGMSGTGREDDPVRREFEQVRPCQLIVADNDRCNAGNTPDELIEVVGERVVVIDDQGFHEAKNN